MVVLYFLSYIIHQRFHHASLSVAGVPQMHWWSGIVAWVGCTTNSIISERLCEKRRHQLENIHEFPVHSALIPENSARELFPIKTDKLPTHLTPKAPCCGKVPKRCWSPRFKWNWSCFGHTVAASVFLLEVVMLTFPKKNLQALTVYGGKPSIFGKASKYPGKMQKKNVKRSKKLDILYGDLGMQWLKGRKVSEQQKAFKSQQLTPRAFRWF